MRDDIRVDGDVGLLNAGHSLDPCFDLPGELIPATFCRVAQHDVDRYRRTFDADAFDRFGGDQVLLQIGVGQGL